MTRTIGKVGYVPIYELSSGAVFFVAPLHVDSDGLTGSRAVFELQSSK